MSNINSSPLKRGQGTSISVPRKDLTKPITRNASFKHVVADPDADFLHKKKIATATARRLAGSPEASSITFVSSGTIPNGQKPVSRDTSPAAPSTPVATITEIDDSPVMSTLDSSLPHVPPTHIGDILAFSIPEFALEMQKQIRQQARRLDEYETRLSAIHQILEENIQLKATNREQERDLSSNASIWSKASPSSSSSKPLSQASTRPQVTKSKPSMAEIVAKKASKPVQPKPKAKKLSAEAISKAARPFMERDPNEPQGFQYIYIGRSRKITRPETRKRFKLVGIDTSRVVDITFPANGVLGVLVHASYAPTFTKIMTSVKAGIINDFDPLDEKHLANPIYKSYTTAARADIAATLNNNRCKQALLYLHTARPTQVKPVGYSFVDLGYISEEELLEITKTPSQDPKSRINEETAKLFNAPVPTPLSKFNSTEAMDEDDDLLNANGLKATTVQDPLSHTLFSDMLLITETWLTPSMLLPTNWPQYHCYGQKVHNANNRGKGGITALFNPLCKYTVLQLPSPNDHTLSLKVGDLRVHCLYLPPSMPINQVFATLDSIPLLPNTIICGDFNARLGSFVGDHQSNPRGKRLLSWSSDNQLRILNESLAYGIPTFSGFRLGQEISSIVDLFITNIAPSSLLSAALQVESDISLSSDHRLMHLTFDLAPSHDDVPLLPDRPLAPRRLWNLNRLKKPAYLQKYRESIKEKIAPLTTKLENWVSSPPLLCPSLDLFNESFNACVYDSLDLSVGNTPSRPSYWHKYWTTELQEAAENRDRCYKRWRRSIGIDKVHWWNQHDEANKLFRKKIQRIKRESWNEFKKSLETNFPKATKTISRIKSRNTHTASFTHTDGPMKAVDIMSTHLSLVYSGSSLPAPSLRPPSVYLHLFLPHSLDNTPFLDDDVISWRIKELPNNKAPGPDHVKAEMLKPVIDILAPFFKLYFTLCFQWSNTPSLWRQATVFPIYKKGDRTDPGNYRPISLTSVLRKLFEMTIVSQVTKLSPTLNHAQGGFRKQFSPLDQAFYDTVDRRVVWNILASKSFFPVPLLNLLIDMFDDVSISVLLANHRSDPFTPITGLLQGSVLSPYLYSLYINSLPGVLRSAASNSTPTVFGLDDDEPVAINSLVLADDVAIFGTKDEVEKS
ncbi:hypothetical protein INT47_008901 [Mucor saturninus]|uniref:Reverse transcriptase domain-containing protein n=1 Tax=Mucor saturninus TaxID=64648 RepID=A0A8H7QII7_9FUNG|nr:hypothetical protein INT47_008901 [Mucor saturninus]